MKIYMVVDQEYFYLGDAYDAEKLTPVILGLFEDFNDAKKCLLDARKKYFDAHMLEGPYYELVRILQENNLSDLYVDEIHNIIHESILAEIHSDELHPGPRIYVNCCTNILYVKEMELHMKGETE